MPAEKGTRVWRCYIEYHTHSDRPNNQRFILAHVAIYERDLPPQVTYRRHPGAKLWMMAARALFNRLRKENVHSLEAIHLFRGREPNEVRLSKPVKLWPVP